MWQRAKQLTSRFTGGLLAAVVLGWTGIVGCSVGPGGGDGWIVGAEDGANDSGVPTETDAEDAGPLGDVDDRAAIVCGEPGEVITTLPEAAKLAPCEVYRGSFRFRLGETDYTNLEMLPDLRVIEGTLLVYGGHLQSLKGLDQLQRVGGALKFSGFADVTSLDNLAHLERVGGEFMVRAVYIEDFCGLERLESTGDMRLIANPELRSFQGLSDLQRIRGDFKMSGYRIPKSEVRAFLERVQIDGETSVRGL